MHPIGCIACRDNSEPGWKKNGQVGVGDAVLAEHTCMSFMLEVMRVHTKATMKHIMVAPSDVIVGWRFSHKAEIGCRFFGT